MIDQGSGFRVPRDAQDEVVTDGVGINYPVDPTQYLGAFVTPGLPVAATRDSAIRGRSQAAPTIQQHYHSKGVLPL